VWQDPRVTGAPADWAALPAIRLPKAVRIYTSVFVVIWCAGVLTAAVVIAVHGSPAAIVPVIMFAFGATIGARTFRMSVAFGADVLIVRNFIRTRTLRREEIEAFRSGAVSYQPFGRTIYALLRDGSVFPLDVASRPYRLGRGRSKLEERLAMLRGWLNQTR
jgi:hypothetical protein